MYNIKIKNGEDLYGRSNFKLRSDMLDPSLLRSKLISDIRNRVGIESISTNYIQLYINDEYMGLYIMTDVINLPWIEDVYDDKKTKYLYKCKYFYDFIAGYFDQCINKNEDVTDHNEWINFLTAVENATSASDIEDIFDVEHFLYEMAIDYLSNASDHASHNFYLYKQPNGKWTYISYDFDLDFNYEINYDMMDEEYIKVIDGKDRLYELLISQDHERFNDILKDIINRVFNPATLFSHIDEIKHFIKPYVILDKTPDANGNFPGAFNDVIPGFKYYTVEEWDDFSEFAISTNEAGLKYIILMKYIYICYHLNMECDPIYLDENYKNSHVKYVEDNYSDNNEYSTYTTKNEIPTTISTKKIPIETTTKIQTEIPNKQYTFTSYKIPLEIETEYEYDEPTFSTDDESSSDEEEDIIEII